MKNNQHITVFCRAAQSRLNHPYPSKGGEFPSFGGAGVVYTCSRPLERGEIYTSIYKITRA